MIAKHSAACRCWRCWLGKNLAPHVEAQLSLNVVNGDFQTPYDAAAAVWRRYP